MADCGDHSHQMIEYANLFDLRDMQLLRAEIDAIDRANNTADITFLDACPDYAVSLADVPFFYHCQYSTGTLEDLANGHNAFSVGDMVYVAHVPENGTTAERMYIVGHVDIRGTRVCPTEFLFISLSFTLNSTSYGFTTVFDTSTGAKLDVDAFVNKDESSPAKPTSLPATSSSIVSWQTYNFGSVPVSGITISGTIDVPGYTLYEFDTGSAECSPTSSTTNYTGNRTADCGTFSAGNGLRADTYSISCTHDDTPTTPINLTEEIATSTDGTGVFPVNYTGSTCGAVFAVTEYAYDRTYSGVVGYFTVSDGVDTVRVPITWVLEKSNGTNSSCDGDQTGIDVATFTGADSFSKTAYYDFTSLSRANVQSDLTWSATVSGNLPLTPTFDASDHSLTISEQTTSHTTEIPFFTIPSIADAEEWFFTPWSNMDTKSSTFLLGRYYVYSIFGVSSVEEWKVDTTEMVAVYNNATAPYPGVVTVAPNNGSAKLILRYKADTCVTNIDQDLAPGPPYYTVSLLDCIRYSHTNLATGLNAVIEELMEYVIDQVIDYSNLTTANEDIQDLRNAVVAGPTCTVLLKRS